MSLKQSLKITTDSLTTRLIKINAITKQISGINTDSSLASFIAKKKKKERRSSSGRNNAILGSHLRWNEEQCLDIIYKKTDVHICV